jgi:hypothetical protein
MKSTYQKRRGYAKEIHPSLESKSSTHALIPQDVKHALSLDKIPLCSLLVRRIIAFDNRFGFKSKLKISA